MFSTRAYVVLISPKLTIRDPPLSLKHPNLQLCEVSAKKSLQIMMRVSCKFLQIICWFPAKPLSVTAQQKLSFQL
jgi:hypothetical protein